METTEWMPFVTIGDFHYDSTRVANLSTYVIPEFYIYVKNIDGTTE